MKKLLPLFFAALVGLASCSEANEKKQEQPTQEVDPTHSAITSYLKKNLDDPASYQPARWGTAKDWLQQDADRIAAKAAGERAELAFTYAKKAMGSTTPFGRKLFDENAAEAKHYQRTQDSLLRSVDTTRLGQVLTHAYRAKNKMGATVLDSAQFVVYKNGQVKTL